MSSEKGPTTRDSSSRWVQWGDLGDVLGQPFDTTRIPIQKLEQMRRDAMIAFGLMFIKVPITRAQWYIRSRDAKRAAFVDGALRRIYGRLVGAYFNCLDYGYSPITKRFEYLVPDWQYVDPQDPERELPVWENKDVKALVWKPFVALNPRYATPSWTKAGDFDGICYLNTPAVPGTTTPKRDPDIPLDWSLWATNEKDSVFGSLWGYPRTGYAYRYWWDYWFKFNLGEQTFERWADPGSIGYYPDNTVDENGNPVDFQGTMLETLEKHRSGANIAMPSSVVVSELDGKSTNVRQWEIGQVDHKVDFGSIRGEFEYLDVMKLRALAIPEQALVEGKGGTSSRNVQSGNYDALWESNAVLAEEFRDQVNRFLIPQLLELNLGPGDPCELVFTGFDPEDVELMRTLVQVVGQADPQKLQVDFRELLERRGIPLLTLEAVNALLEKQAQLAAETMPPTVDQGTGMTGAAGTTTTGQYQQSQPSVRVPTSTTGTANYSEMRVERVDILPVQAEGAVAYYDRESNTLFALSELSDEDVEYHMQLASGVQVFKLAEQPDGDTEWKLRRRIEELEARVDQPVAPVVIDLAEQPREVSKSFVRDEHGRLIGLRSHYSDGSVIEKRVNTDEAGRILSIEAA